MGKDILDKWIQEASAIVLFFFAILLLISGKNKPQIKTNQKIIRKGGGFL